MKTYLQKLVQRQNLGEAEAGAAFERRARCGADLPSLLAADAR